MLMDGLFCVCMYHLYGLGLDVEVAYLWIWGLSKDAGPTTFLFNVLVWYGLLFVQNLVELIWYTRGIPL